MAHVDSTIQYFGKLSLGSTQALEKGHQKGAKLLYKYSDHRNIIPQFIKKVRIF